MLKIHRISAFEPAKLDIIKNVTMEELVPDVTMTYIRGWMQRVYRHMNYSPETGAYMTMRCMNIAFRTLIIFTYKMITIRNVLRTLCTMGPLCHAWLFFPSSLLLYEAVVSSSAGDQLLILLPAWGARPSPHSPYPGWPYFPQAPGTFPTLCWTQYCVLNCLLKFSSLFLYQINFSCVFKLTFLKMSKINPLLMCSCELPASGTICLLVTSCCCRFYRANQLILTSQLIWYEDISF